ncbi:hypothetical protein BD410DRAFT_787708 [Rickenella mellea]|uniref:Fungal-type protein kinase domain-containing protein n=1 Tax=Rickenella mellea TaxID=50990 RepID=A0A4Y7Q6P8_9AGAM|nr:hypothetical protein BD410DRAFT_787708 [Rickenella mellea]
MARRETHKNIDSYVDEEIGDAMLKTGSIDFITHKIPHHDDALPFSPEVMLDALSVQSEDGTSSAYDSENKKWRNWPATDKGCSNGDIEHQVAAYINAIANTAVTHFKQDNAPEARFQWDGSYAVNGIWDERTNCKRKPDLVAREPEAEAVDWTRVRALFELKCHKRYRTDALKELASHARMVFGNQVNRRFVLAVLLTDTAMTLTVFNRSGAVTSKDFDVHKNPDLFLRVAVGILFLPDEYLGYDNTIDLVKNEIRVNGKAYPIDSVIYQEPSLRGRGTVCFRVVIDGGFGVVKDGWVDKSRTDKEWSLLEEAEGVENVAQMVDHEILQFQGAADSTEKDLSFVKKSHDIEIRTHVRLVVTPYGTPIYNFKDKRELLQAFIDIVKAHRDLYKNKKILHRDMSLRNMLLAESYDSLLESYRRGLLIDLDFAIRMSDLARHLAKGLRTGTTPFMAIHILLGTATHDADHDLESVFYVFCWICITRAGPGRTRKDFAFEKSHLSWWVGEPLDRPNSIGAKKFATIQADSFKTWILNEFHPYFHGLRTCAMSLRDILFSNFNLSGDVSRNPNLHEDFIKVFQTALDDLPSDDEENVSSDDEGNGDETNIFDRYLHQARNLLDDGQTTGLKRKVSVMSDDDDDGDGDDYDSDNEEGCGADNWRGESHQSEDLFDGGSPSGGLRSIGSMRSHSSKESENKRLRL